MLKGQMSLQNLKVWSWRKILFAKIFEEFVDLNIWLAFIWKLAPLQNYIVCSCNEKNSKAMHQKTRYILFFKYSISFELFAKIFDPTELGNLNLIWKLNWKSRLVELCDLVLNNSIATRPTRPQPNVEKAKM